MSKLLSHDGLRAEIASILLLDGQAMEPYVSVVDDLINLINTQKCLYAESVIEEDGMSNQDTELRDAIVELANKYRREQSERAGMRMMAAAGKNMNKFMERYGLEHTIVGQDPEMDNKWEEALKSEPNFPNLRHESEL